MPPKPPKFPSTLARNWHQKPSMTFGGAVPFFGDVTIVDHSIATVQIRWSSIYIIKLIVIILIKVKIILIIIILIIIMLIIIKY